MTSRLIARGCIAILIATLSATSTELGRAAAPDVGTESQRESGKKLYMKNCSQCHGEKGDGEGYAAVHLRPRPRNFTTAKFKIRTTPNGALPMHQDLVNIIRPGMLHACFVRSPFAAASVSDATRAVRSWSSAVRPCRSISGSTSFNSRTLPLEYVASP